MAEVTNKFTLHYRRKKGPKRFTNLQLTTATVQHSQQRILYLVAKSSLHIFPSSTLCFFVPFGIDKMTSEATSLLPITTKTSDDLNLRHDNNGSFNGESIEVAEMKKVTHNDPTLDAESEDYKNLLGSTRFLYNNVRAEEMSASLRRQAVDDLRGISSTEKVSGRHSSSSTGLSLIYNQQRNHAMLYLEKVKTNFFQDAKSLAEGTIPQSVVLALVIGVVCGIACWLYYSILFFFLELLWTTLPELIVVDKWGKKYHWLWIPLVSFVMITFVGLTVVYLGEPGDLPYTIGRVHAQAFIPMNHVSPMVFASLFSILGKCISGNGWSSHC